MSKIKPATYADWLEGVKREVRSVLTKSEGDSFDTSGFSDGARQALRDLYGVDGPTTRDVLAQVIQYIGGEADSLASTGRELEHGSGVGDFTHKEAHRFSKR